MSFTVHPHRLQHFGVEAFPRRCRTTSARLRRRRGHVKLCPLCRRSRRGAATFTPTLSRREGAKQVDLTGALPPFEHWTTFLQESAAGFLSIFGAL